MGNIIQHLRGSVVDHSTYTGKKGEISLVTDASEARIPTGEIRIHDDSTPGGLPLVLGTTTNPLTSNIVLGSGVGINFHNYGSEDSNSATIVGNNLLDDYETGTFTPNLDTSNGDLADFEYFTRYGKYIKVGNLATVSIELATKNAASVSGTGYIEITGLPFIVLDNTNGGRNCLALTHDNRWTNNPQFGQSQSTTTSIRLFKGNSMNNGTDAMTVSDMRAYNNGNFNLVTIMFTYLTS